MSFILQIESSSEICSVALSQNGATLFVVEDIQPNSHSEKITILIKQCLDNAGINFSQLDAVAVSDGPGSYTSLRVGVSVAKGICYAKDIPLIAIDSLLILACGIDINHVAVDDLIIPMIDARRMEVYTSIFRHDYSQYQDTGAIIIENDPFSSLVSGNQKIHICGNGAAKYYNHHKSDAIIMHHSVTSSSFMSLSSFKYYKEQQFVDVAYYTPNYFKAPYITKSNKKLF